MFSRHRGHTFVAPPTDNAITIYISENTFDFNLLARIGAAFSVATTVTIRVETGVIVASLSTGTPAMDLSNVMFAGSTLRLINNGYIQGRGGDGGDGAYFRDVGDNTEVIENAQDGRDGGDAIVGPGAGITFEITNGAGRIWGGGGGGGGGGLSNRANENESLSAGGGGGGGAGGGAGGRALAGGNRDANAAAVDGAHGSTGVNGTFGTGGAGGQANNATGGAGGAGGDWGAAGSAGVSPTSFTHDEPGGAGGAAGKAIELNGGAATFLNGSGSPNVRGAVS